MSNETVHSKNTKSPQPLPQHNQTDLSVVIPAFNEARRIERTLTATLAYLAGRGGGASFSFEVLVVDDGSGDDTAGVVTRWAAGNGFAESVVRVLRYEPNRGKGYAVRHGVLRSVGARVLFMDADLATPIEELPKLEAVLDGHQGRSAASSSVVAIGSRPLRKSELIVRQPLYRELLGKAFNKFVQVLAAPGIMDTQCGFKLFPGALARQIFALCTLDRFSFDVEVIYLARKLGGSVVEVPVRWAHQEGAAAFTTPRAYLLHGLQMLGDVPRIRWTHRHVRRLVSSTSSAYEAVAKTRTFPLT